MFPSSEYVPASLEGEDPHHTSQTSQQEPTKLHLESSWVVQVLPKAACVLISLSPLRRQDTSDAGANRTELYLKQHHPTFSLFF